MISFFPKEPPAGDGHPVLVLPGLAADDQATAMLRSYLRQAGYDARAWELGRNLGPRSIGADGSRLLMRVEAIARSTGRKVSIIGWSLGGLMAREVARAHPHLVRQVITLGTPLIADPKSMRGWQLYELLIGEAVTSEDAYLRLKALRGPLSVPSASIYSRSDGVVSWSACIQATSDRSENIKVSGSHWGLPSNTEVLAVIADRLPEGTWVPYRDASASGSHKHDTAPNARGAATSGVAAVV